MDPLAILSLTVTVVALIAGFIFWWKPRHPGGGNPSPRAESNPAPPLYPPTESSSILTDEELQHMRDSLPDEPNLFVLNYSGPVRNTTAPEPDLSFKLTYNPSQARFDAMDVKVDWQSPKASGTDEHRPVVERMRAGEYRRFDFEIDPRVESWSEFDLSVEVEFWLSGDYTKFEHYWAGDVIITKPPD